MFGTRASGSRHIGEMRWTGIRSVRSWWWAAVRPAGWPRRRWSGIWTGRAKCGWWSPTRSASSVSAKPRCRTSARSMRRHWDWTKPSSSAPRRAPSSSASSSATGRASVTVTCTGSAWSGTIPVRPRSTITGCASFLRARMSATSAHINYRRRLRARTASFPARRTYHLRRLSRRSPTPTTSTRRYTPVICAASQKGRAWKGSRAGWWMSNCVQRMVSFQPW